MPLFSIATLAAPLVLVAALLRAVYVVARRGVRQGQIDAARSSVD